MGILAKPKKEVYCFSAVNKMSHMVGQVTFFQCPNGKFSIIEDYLQRSKFLLHCHPCQFDIGSELLTTFFSDAVLGFVKAKPINPHDRAN